MAEKVKRCYGKEKTIGDILYDKKGKVFFFFLKVGVVGFEKIYLTKNAEGTYDLTKTYHKDGESAILKLGKSFPVKTKEGKEVEGLTQASLGLSTQWNPELKKEVTSTNDALYLVFHKLKEPKSINDDLSKVGWVTGRFGIEVEVESEKPEGNKEETPVPPEVHEEIPEISINEDEIPF